VHYLSKNTVVPFADDTGIIIINPNPVAFINEIKKVLKTHTHTHIYDDGFVANLLNIDKDYFMHFSSKNSSLTNLNIMIRK